MKWKLDLTRLTSLKATKIAAIILSIVFIVSFIILLYCNLNKQKEGELVYEDPSYIEVTKEEMAQYREMIGDGMDVKKAKVILFETEQECIDFIAAHGDDEHPEKVGEGIVPLMENGYYNIAGKEIMEDVFDSLNDGEYTTEPFSYSNLYCYMKRIGVHSPIDNDEELKALIQNEKMQELKKEGE